MAETKKKREGFGRPMKLTRELITKVAATVASGCYLDTAARFHGVSKASFHDWMKRGHEQQRGIYRDFLDAIEVAQAKADVRDHALIAAAAAKDWKASEVHLKLRHPGRYNVKRQELTGADGKTIGVSVSTSTEASLLALFTRLAGGGDDGGEG